MIESCNKNRMLIGIVLLGGLTLIVLIIESHWTVDSASHLKPIDNSSNSEYCWTKEDYEIVEACHPCSDFEVASKSVTACIATKYKEVVRCTKSGLTQRSCEKVAWLDERNFWIFEACMFVLAVISTSTVFVRQHVLDRRVMQRIQKQLSNGLVN